MANYRRDTERAETASRLTPIVVRPKMLGCCDSLDFLGRFYD